METKRREFLEACEHPAPDAQGAERQAKSQAEATIELIDQRINVALEDYNKTLRDTLSHVVAYERLARDAEVEEGLTRALAGVTKKVEARLVDFEQRRLSATGKIPPVQVWRKDAVAFEGQLFSHSGSLWQARMTPGQTPGGPHWVCVARGGEVVEVDAAGALDQRLSDARRQIRAEAAEEQAQMLEHVEGMIAAAEERMLKAPASRPAFDRGQLDRDVGVAVARASATLNEAVDRALEAQRREVETKLAAVSERTTGALGGLDRGRLDRIEKSVEEIHGEFEARAKSERAARREEVEGAVSKVRNETGEKLLALNEQVGDVFAGLDRDWLDRVEDANDRIRGEFDTRAEEERADQRDEVGEAVVELRAEFATKVGDLERRLKNATGRLPPVKAWNEGVVVYQGELASFNGSSFQAARDTGREPGVGEDWLLVAARGHDGALVSVRGQFDPSDSYGALDIVAHAGSSYIARRSDPGAPGDGDGWQRLAAKGERGEPGKVGQRGHKGDRGPAGAKIDEWRISREHFVAVPFYDDGTAGPPLRLRELFREYQNQTG